MSSAHGSHGSDELVAVCRLATLRRAEYQFYRTILLAFPETGGPHDRATLRQLARRHSISLEATLADMARQDLVQRDSTTGVIRAAYPFSGVPTAHRVTLLADSNDPTDPADPTAVAPVRLYAMCALDALGIPLMLCRDALVTSVDPLTGEPVRVAVRRVNADEVSVNKESDAATSQTVDGWRAVWEPATAVVFARPEEHECAG